jgi:hypothetical protein
MKIFSPSQSNSPKENSAVKKNVKGRRHDAAPLKKEVSDEEIRKKLASHVETSNTAKAQVIQKNSQALGSGFMKEDTGQKVDAQKIVPRMEVPDGESEDSLKKSHLLLTDVKLNDPNDTNTQEKLKNVLRNGAFSFNPKEKETLEKILAST